MPADGCATPVAPHNASNAATWSYVGNTITLTGVGAYLGLSKPYNGSELTSPSGAPASITYTVTSLTSALMTLDIAVNGVGWWRYNFTKQGVAATCNDLIQNGDETGVDCGGTSCPACSNQINLPVTFEGSSVDYTMSNFGNNVSTLVVDPTNANNMVMKVDKPLSAPLWAGTTIGTPSGFSTAIPFTSTNRKMYVRVWSPDAGIPIRLKVEVAGDPTKSCETDTNTTVASAWETIEFDFDNEAIGTAAFNAAYSFNMASIFFNFGTDGATAGAKTYYFDDVSYGAVLSVSNFELAAGVTMSPNPSSNFLNFTSIEKIDSISVTNLLGQTLFSKTIQNDTFSVDVSELAKGQYFINLHSVVRLMLHL